MSAWGGFKNRFSTLLAAAVLFGAFGVGLGLSRHFIFYLVMMFLYGIPLTAFQTATTSILQERVDEQMQGIVFGPLADFVSLRLLIILSSIALMLISSSVIPWISKSCTNQTVSDS